MSVQAMTWAIDLEIKPMPKLVLICLANYSDKDGHAFPGQKRLAEDSGLSVRAVRDNLEKLEFCGAISRQHRQRKSGARTSDFYQLNLETKGQMLPVGDGKSNRQIATVQPADAAGGQPADAAGVYEPSDSLTVTEPSESSAREPTSLFGDDEKPKKPPTIKSILAYLLGDDLAKAVIDHRKALRKPLTIRAAELLAGEFSKTHDPQKAAETMIVQGWTGFKVEWMARVAGDGNGRASSSQVTQRMAEEFRRAGH